MCSRVLAGNSTGVQKCRLNVLCSNRPSESELRDTAKLEASLGGLSAVQIVWADELKKWTVDEHFDDHGQPLPLREHDFEVERAAGWILVTTAVKLSKSRGPLL